MSDNTRYRMISASQNVDKSLRGAQDYELSQSFDSVHRNAIAMLSSEYLDKTGGSGLVLQGYRWMNELAQMDMQRGWKVWDHMDANDRTAFCQMLLGLKITATDNPEEAAIIVGGDKAYGEMPADHMPLVAQIITDNIHSDFYPTPDGRVISFVVGETSWPMHMDENYCVYDGAPTDPYTAAAFHTTEAKYFTATDHTIPMGLAAYVSEKVQKNRDDKEARKYDKYHSFGGFVSGCMHVDRYEEKICPAELEGLGDTAWDVEMFGMFNGQQGEPANEVFTHWTDYSREPKELMELGKLMVESGLCSDMDEWRLHTLKEFAYKIGQENKSQMMPLFNMWVDYSVMPDLGDFSIAFYIPMVHYNQGNYSAVRCVAQCT